MSWAVKKEIEVLSTTITTKCGTEVEVNTQKLRSSRIAQHNIPDAINPENAEENIVSQNPELNLNTGDLQPKFCYISKKGKRILVIEVGPKVRKVLLESKIKMDWLICKAYDYVVATRCFKCS